MVLQFFEILPAETTAYILENNLTGLEIAKYLTKVDLGIEQIQEIFLIHACVMGWEDVVKYLVELGVDIHIDDDKPLRKSIQHTNENIIKFLVESGANINSYNCKCLANAIWLELYDIAKYLLEHGADVQTNNRALESAIGNHHLEMTKLLLSYGANYNNVQIIVLAVQYQDMEILKLLVESGVDKQFIDHALIKSIQYNMLNIAKFLLEVGADPQVMTCFDWSPRSESLEMIKLLFQYGGTDYNDMNDALGLAAEHGQHETVKFLLEQGADVHADNDYAIIWSANHGYDQIVKLLLEYGANINALANDPLYKSAGNGHLSTVKLLLENGANREGLNDALVHSAMNNNYEVVKFLLENGADLHHDHNSAFSYSICFTEHEYVARLFLDHGADANNISIIEKCIDQNLDQSIVLLLEYGMKITSEYLRRSIQSDHWGITELLLKNYPTDFHEFNENPIQVQPNQLQTISLLEEYRVCFVITALDAT